MKTIILIVAILMLPSMAFSGVNDQDKHGMTELHWAVRRNQNEQVYNLIQGGANMNQKDNYGWTPLHFAVSQLNKSAVKILIYFKADLNVATNRGWTPLHYASNYGALDLVQLLTDNGGSVRTRNITGETPIHLATDDEVRNTLISVSVKYSKNNRKRKVDSSSDLLTSTEAPVASCSRSAR